MRILARVNLSLPWHGAGAEVYLHSCLRELVRRGHDALVLARGAPAARELDGVHIAPAAGYKDAAGLWDPDLVVTHLDDTLDGFTLAARLRRPLVAIFHNHRQASIYRHSPANTALAVWNSRWTFETATAERHRAPAAGADLVLPPPVDPADYTITEDELVDPDVVTLINLQPEKGVYHAIRLAEQLPSRRFLFVVGGYGRQIRPALPNVEVVGPLSWRQMRDEVYERTRVLLMPSEYETYGRCAVEAAHAGIPTIAHPTGGLVEALGTHGAGIFAHRDQTAEWLRILGCLEDTEMYAQHSLAARARAAELDPTPGYDALEQALLEAAA